jgi:lysophospholipase L1-like esterase
MKKVLSLIIVATIIYNCGSTSNVTPEIVVDPLRFSAEIAEFKMADSLNKPRPNSVLFVGSSSIRGWKTLAADFPELDVMNRGFGGSHMSDLIFFLDELVFQYNPNAIVVYEGDNDIAAGKTAEEVARDYDVFVSRVLERWPNKPIFFVSIKPSLARIDHMENMAKANALVRARADQADNLYYIDVFSAMLGEDGSPRKDIFIADGLHLNETGYALWTKIVREELGL